MDIFVSFTEKYPGVVLGILGLILVAMYFRKHLLEFILEHIVFFFIVIIVLGTSLVGIYDSAKEEKELEFEEKLSDAEYSLINDFEDYTYTDDEIPYVDADIWPSESEAGYIYADVRFYDKFDTYTPEQQLVLVHTCNQRLTEDFSVILSNSDYYSYCLNDYHIEIDYDTNAIEYDEYTFEKTIHSYDLTISGNLL